MDNTDKLCEGCMKSPNIQWWCDSCEKVFCDMCNAHAQKLLKTNGTQRLEDERVQVQTIQCTLRQLVETVKAKQHELTTEISKIDVKVSELSSTDIDSLYMMAKQEVGMKPQPETYYEQLFEKVHYKNRLKLVKLQRDKLVLEEGLKDLEVKFQSLETLLSMSHISPCDCARTEKYVKEKIQNLEERLNNIKDNGNI